MSPMVVFPTEDKNGNRSSGYTTPRVGRAVRLSLGLGAQARRAVLHACSEFRFLREWERNGRFQLCIIYGDERVGRRDGKAGRHSFSQPPFTILSLSLSLSSFVIPLLHISLSHSGDARRVALGLSLYVPFLFSWGSITTTSNHCCAARIGSSG